MDILVASNRAYLKYLRVLMVSVYENHKHLVSSTDSEGIIFWVMHNGLNEDDYNYVKEVADMYEQEVKFVMVDKEKSANFLNQFKYTSTWSMETMFRLFAHILLPKEVKRVLYLDIDIVVNGDLTDYYNIEFDDCYFVASRDTYKPYDARKEPVKEFEEFDRISEEEFDLKIAALGNQYFNAGVLLMNLEKMRADNIDINFYSKKINEVGCENIGYLDQGILNICFAKEVKLLKTCKYNYRIAFSSKGYYNPKNFHKNSKYNYTFTPIKAKIYHYCGFISHYKPWIYKFKESELTNNELLTNIPESYEYIAMWWKYAEKVPDYDLLVSEMNNQLMIYRAIEKLFISKNIAMCNTLGLETLRVPTGMKNNIVVNESLNDFTLPKVYRCVDGKTKETIKDLPESFIHKCGFRLTVKNIAANDGDNTAILQILEPNEPNASIYRRYGKSRGGNSFGKWQKVFMLPDDEVSQFEELKNRLMQLEKSTEKQFIEMENELKNTKKSFSYKLGRAITWFPRLILRPFRKKNNKT